VKGGVTRTKKTTVMYSRYF